MDLVWSNLAIQWCNDLDQAFGEMARVLRPEGLLMFSTFGPDTLKELREASAADPSHVHVSRFIDMHDIGDALVRAGFSAPVMDVEHFVLTYDDVLGVMRDLKAIGARNAAQGRPRGLEGKGFLARLTERYERFREQGKLPATFEVVYGHAWKSESAASVLPDGASVIKLHRK
jgi:malonyl-CoA O-methyltransferase